MLLYAVTEQRSIVLSISGRKVLVAIMSEGTWRLFAEPKMLRKCDLSKYMQ